MWLNQEQMAELFQKAKSTINEHIKHIYAEGELQQSSTMKKFGNTEFKKSFGVNANDYDGIAYYGHQSVMNSETILVIRLKSEDQGENIIDIINTLKETNMELFKSYAADQYKLLSESVLEQKGKYVLYVVSDDAGSIEKAFTKSITE